MFLTVNVITFIWPLHESSRLMKIPRHKVTESRHATAALCVNLRTSVKSYDTTDFTDFLCDTSHELVPVSRQVPVDNRFHDIHSYLFTRYNKNQQDTLFTFNSFQ